MARASVSQKNLPPLSQQLAEARATIVRTANLMAAAGPSAEAGRLIAAAQGAANLVLIIEAAARKAER